MEPEGSLPRSRDPVTGPNPHQDARPSPGPVLTLRNKLVLRRVFSPLPILQAEGPHVSSCSRLLIQYIRIYPPNLEAFPPSAT